MKTLKLISFFTLVFLLLTVVSCSDDDDSVTLGELSGIVTYPNTSGAQVAAENATVRLMGTTETLITMTGADGSYSFPNLEAGEYDLGASFFVQPENARLDGLNFATAADVTLAMTSNDLTQNLTLVSVGQSGADLEVLNANYTWNGSAYAQSGTWTYDATHSPIAFEFPYRGEVGDFIGAFSQLHKVVINFDPANPSAGTIDVAVDVASINTRSPGGRDPRTTIADNPPWSPATLFTEYGCLINTVFGISADGGTPSDGTPLTITTDTDRYSTFVSTSIAKYGDGYLAKGNLKLNGVTAPVELWFKQVPAWTDPSNNRRYTGFEGKFLMDAKGVFGVTSSSLNDAICRIQISIVLYKQL